MMRRYIIMLCLAATCASCEKKLIKTTAPFVPSTKHFQKVDTIDKIYLRSIGQDYAYAYGGNADHYERHLKHILFADCAPAERLLPLMNKAYVRKSSFSLGSNADTLEIKYTGAAALLNTMNFLGSNRKASAYFYQVPEKMWNQKLFEIVNTRTGAVFQQIYVSNSAVVELYYNSDSWSIHIGQDNEDAVNHYMEHLEENALEGILYMYMGS